MSVFRLRCVVGLQVLVLFSACGQSPVDERPSLVLVLADDQRFDTLSCAGGVHVQTPSLDQIAAQGAFFERAYVTTSLCCPARAGILTGLYAHRTQIRNNEDDVDFLASDRKSTRLNSSHVVTSYAVFCLKK